MNLTALALTIAAGACAGDDAMYDGTPATPTATATLTATASATATTTASTSGDATTEGSGASDSGGTEDTGGSGPSLKYDVGDSDGDGGSGDATTGPDDSMCPCGDKLDLIYVLSDDRELWTYDPANNSFALVGPLGCPTSDGTFSMGVGRDGYAWIQTTKADLIQGINVGDLYELDVNNPANCTDPGYNPGANAWIHFGMAFVSNSADDPCDRLYGQHWNGQSGQWNEGPGVGKLGVFDEQALQMTTIGATNYNGAELTGTGDGRLYAFGGVPNAKLIQFDKASASEVESITFNGFPLTNAFAFAFWGGDFYFFTNSVENGIGTPSKVTKLDYDNSDGDGQVLTTVNNSAPILVVGAGVSTCAPLMPPG
ncbi:MAG: hypothetical protein KC486_15760 [Myxococcales bacterium]|nr:hypothetical protein [Myxococcales bacterium]